MTVKLQISNPSQRLGIVTIHGASNATLMPGASSAEAIVRLIDPDPTAVITIRDNRTGGVASVAVQRPSQQPPQPKEQPTPKPKEEPKPKPKEDPKAP